MKRFPADQADRELAATHFEHNIVVTAGAGTGKTTLLIQRLLHLLLRAPDPLEITQIVALTFTKKSANELKVRLSLALESLLDPECPGDKIETFTIGYQRSLSSVQDLARVALQNMARSEIGTIHHFATNLLRRYPMEAKLDPNFEIDEDGAAFETRFGKAWDAWLEKELSLESPRKTEWLSLLASFTLSDLQAFARCLTTENVAPQTEQKATEQTLAPAILEWFQLLKKESAALLAEHEQRRKVESQLELAERLFSHCIERGDPGSVEEALREELANASAASKPKGWEQGDFAAATRLIGIARKCLEVDEDKLRQVRILLFPFVSEFQVATRGAARVSFDDLLVKTRDLLRDHPYVREALKTRIQSLLIDEFQDTDPVQYEILLFLSERGGQQKKCWQEIQLEPGKLFVVGDPKQSIYGFRRADIGAYHAVREFILKQSGRHVFLKTNFRSHAGILKVVNGICEPLIKSKAGLQAKYIAIHAPEQTEKEFTLTEKLSFRSVGLASLPQSDETLDAKKAGQQEAESVASWLADTVISQQKIRGRDGEIRLVTQSDVAILMRSLTGVQPFLDALRRRGIDYLVEGERHFYRKQIVTDAINLLTAIAEPDDRVALVAVLRSPLGGFPDDVIYEMQQRKGLHREDQKYEALSDWPVAQMLFKSLDRLASQVHFGTVAEAIDWVLEQVPLNLIAAASLEGEQALANLEKLRAEAIKIATTKTVGFVEVVAQLRHKMLVDFEETQSPLVEEGMDAVCISSIHKAKGLEFPVVVLAGCQSGDRPTDRARAIIRHDWSTALIGMRIAETCDLASVFLAQQEKERETEEEKRLLYVAMTRAREHLFFSAASTRFGRGSMLSMLQVALGEESLKARLEAPKGTLEFGEGRMRLFPHESRLVVSPSDKKQKETIQIDEGKLANIWKQRREDCDRTQVQKIFVSPTALKTSDEASGLSIESSHKKAHRALNGRLIGELAHHFLETWVFESKPKDIQQKIARFLSRQDLSQEKGKEQLIQDELEEIFSVFFKSESYQTLCDSTIIARELPFIMPWGDQVMEGTIDLVYEYDGELYITDYKTDRVEPHELKEVVKKYTHQSEVYPEAIRRSLQRNVAGMVFVVLRLGVAVEG